MAFNTLPPSSVFFFFNDTATTEIYTLSLHDALPISQPPRPCSAGPCRKPSVGASRTRSSRRTTGRGTRSEEHTSELQSRLHLVCRLLLEKKKTIRIKSSHARSTAQAAKKVCDRSPFA